MDISIYSWSNWVIRIQLFLDLPFPIPFRALLDPPAHLMQSSFILILQQSNASSFGMQNFRTTKDLSHKSQFQWLTINSKNLLYQVKKIN